MKKMEALVIDIGGSNVKILANGRAEPRRLPSGPKLNAKTMVAGVKSLAESWACDAVAIGYAGVVINDQPATEPHNLAPGWVGFDYRAAFGCPVKFINDAAMQALGSSHLWEVQARPARKAIVTKAPARKPATKADARRNARPAKAA